MSVAQFERQILGEPLTDVERIVGGLIVAIGTIGHAALGLAVAAFVYAVLFAL